MVRKFTIGTALAAFVTMAAPAWAEPVTVRTGLHADFARIVFDWKAPVTHRVEQSGDSLVIRFERKIEASYDRLPRRLRAYVKTARATADGLGVRLSLAQPVTTTTFLSGTSVVYDLRPRGAQATPADVPKVSVRAGEHAAFERLVFDWPRKVDYRFRQEGKRIEARFAAPANLDLGQVRRTGLPLVRDVRASVEGGETVVSIELTRAAEARHFRVEDRRVVVDISRTAAAPKTTGKPKPSPPAPKPTEIAKPAPAKPAPEKPAPVRRKLASDAGPKRVEAAPVAAEPARPAPAPKAAPAVSSAPKKSSRPAGPKRPTAPPTKPAAQASDPELAALYEARDQIAKELSETRVKISVVAPSESRRAPATGKPMRLHRDGVGATGKTPRSPSAPGPTVDEAATPAAATAGDRPKAVVVGNPNGLSIRLAETGEGMDMRFQWPVPVAAAAYAWRDDVWLVFDRHDQPDLAGLAARDGPLQRIEQLRYSGATILRLRLRDGLTAGLRREGPIWFLATQRERRPPKRAIATVRQMKAAGGARVFLPVIDTGKRVPVHDPDTGELFYTVPVLPSEYGVPRTREFAEFTVLASIQGVAVKPKSDEIAVAALRNGVAVTKAGGLTLSDPAAAKGAGQSHFRICRGVTGDSRCSKRRF